MVLSKALLVSCIACSVSLTTAVLTTQSLLAASIPYNQSLDVVEGYNFQSSSHAAVGYLTGLTVNNISLSPDQTVIDPAPSVPASLAGGYGSVNGRMNVVAVLSGVQWGGGVSDALVFTGLISAANALALRNSQASSLLNKNERFAFVTYGYDQVSQAYFRGFRGYQGSACGSTTALANGDRSQIPLSGLQNQPLTIDLQPNSSVPGRIAYNFSLRVSPCSTVSQILQIQTAVNKTAQKAWGLTVGTVAAPTMP